MSDSSIEFHQFVPLFFFFLLSSFFSFFSVLYPWLSLPCRHMIGQCKVQRLFACSPVSRNRLEATTIKDETQARNCVEIRGRTHRDTTKEKRAHAPGGQKEAEYVLQSSVSVDMYAFTSPKDSSSACP